MDAVNFLKTIARICSVNKDCSECVVGKFNKICPVKEGQEEDMVIMVDKWAKEHRIKTRLSDFLEKYPNAPLDPDGFPELCAEKLGYKGICNNYEVFCHKCWSIPIE